MLLIDKRRGKRFYHNTFSAKLIFAISKQKFFSDTKKKPFLFKGVRASYTSEHKSNHKAKINRRVFEINKNIVSWGGGTDILLIQTLIQTGRWGILLG